MVKSQFLVPGFGRQVAELDEVIARASVFSSDVESTLSKLNVYAGGPETSDDVQTSKLLSPTVNKLKQILEDAKKLRGAIDAAVVRKGAGPLATQISIVRVYFDVDGWRQWMGFEDPKTRNPLKLK